MSSLVAAFLRRRLGRGSLPWCFPALALAAAVVQLNPGWRATLLYDRAALAGGEWWRLWSGHCVHFGWPHFVADVGLLLVLGAVWPRGARGLGHAMLVALPPLISAALFLGDPGLATYAGLSAVNLGLLVFIACRGWQQNRRDWFWPVVLAIYVAEVILEATLFAGRGGGLIRFDDPSVRISTLAHVPGAVAGVLLWLASMRRTAAIRPKAG